ncbi:ladinin-1 [Paramormyrops kingsleyae]|uniref:ladinin-1 n=1 Tax=Paramormyrops kingsleyae TaxID=1676925 RepID=UPI003B97B852
MSISRKNWSALSSLTRQWTVEDEEEVERERRRKNRSHSNATDPDDDPTEDSAPTAVGSTQDGQDAADQAQVDFMEMLQVRDQRRRKRQEEVLRQQRLQEAGQDEVTQASWQEARVGGEMSERVQSQETAPVDISADSTVKNQGGNKKLDAEPGTPKESSRKFVSSLSISFDKGPTSPPGGSSLSSPMSPTGFFRAVSPDQPSTTVRKNGDAQECENDSPSKGVTSPRGKEQNPFKRQNYRAWSFRVMRKKEEKEKSLPFQRSASFRISSNNIEAAKAPNDEEDKQSPFLRNSRQRISSRSIQETMEKLALAAQKSEKIRSPTATQQSPYSSDEVSRKREIFEKEQQERAEPDRGTQHRFNVTVASKRQLWQRREEEAQNGKAQDPRRPQS